MTIETHFQQLHLTSDQRHALGQLEVFLGSPTQIFQLKGYAGSGKTTLIKGLVSYLQEAERTVKLMAPTGRAAKVLCERTGFNAYTIHKTIYSYDDLVQVPEGQSFMYYYKLVSADAANMVFIVDEASMISDAPANGEFFRFGTGRLLSDLIAYSRVTSPLTNNKIIFVGDPCQLPPVNDKDSFAFDKIYLKEKFSVTVDEAEMKEVKRQGAVSGILNASSKIRKSITSGFFNDFDLRDNQTDINNLSYETFLDTWEAVADPKIVVAYKNDTCRKLNATIRARKWGKNDLPIGKGDLVIIGGNSYSKGIFNGEFAVVNEADAFVESRTIAMKDKSPVTLTWRNVELVFPDTDEKNKVVKGKMIENFLNGENLMTPDEMQALFVDFKNRHPDLALGSEEFKQEIINDEYFNCIKLKFGYAVTCHKAQGGEWATVFSIWDYSNNNSFDFFKEDPTILGKTNKPFFRWAYTAVTRASKKLYAIKPPRFNSYSTISFADEDVQETLASLTGQPILPTELQVADELLEEMKSIGLTDQPIPVQDHFLAVREKIRANYFEITAWEKKGYEILYTFQREEKHVKVKTWIDKNNLFNGKFMHQPTRGGSAELFTSLEPLLQLIPKVSVQRGFTETILSKIEFDLEQEERFPFTRLLFDDLQSQLSLKSISIEEVDHQSYRERYWFSRGSEQAVIDFQYNNNGFFGRALPLRKRSNSDALIVDIKEAVLQIKSGNYVS